MVAISFSFLFCLSQKLWEEEEMKPLSIGKQDNKFYEWFYVRFVTETEKLDQICSIWQLGQVWEWKIENWRWQQPKTEELLGFYGSWKLQQKLKTTQVPRSSVVEVGVSPTQNFGSQTTLRNQNYNRAIRCLTGRPKIFIRRRPKQNPWRRQKDAI